MAFFDTAWYVNFGDGSTTGYYAVPVWPGALSAVTAGTWCRQLATPTVGNERCFVCVTAGTTGAAEPVWVVTRGADSAANIDGTVKWMECTGMAGPCGDLTNAPTWTTVKNSVVTLGEVIYDSGSASLQACTTGGTAGNGSTPAFSATAGTTTADNTITWTSLGPTSNYTTAFKYPHARTANSLASTWGAAGNKFGVASNHAETQATSLTLTVPGTITSLYSMYCIDSTTTFASPTLRNTATISLTSTAGFVITGSYFYLYGVNFSWGNGSASNSTCSFNNLQSAYLEKCNFTCATTSNSASSGLNFSTGGNTVLNFKDCNFIFSAANQTITCQSPDIFMQGGSIATLSGSTILILLSGSGTFTRKAIFDAVDLSGVTSSLLKSGFINASNTLIEFFNSKLAAGVSPLVGSPSIPDGYIKMHNSDNAATNYRYFYASFTGSIQQETTIVRSGSLATDGTTGLSWNITTNTGSSFSQPLLSEEVTQWNNSTGSVITATVYLATNDTLNNNDFWAEIEYLGSSGSPLGTTLNSRMVPLATPVVLTSDSSTWGGSTTNKYKVALTFTPQMKGPVKLRLYAAKASTTIYVDPFIYLTDANGNLKSAGRSFLISGGSYANETAPSLMQLPFTGGIHG